jgi:hypothetical protein
LAAYPIGRTRHMDANTVASLLKDRLLFPTAVVLSILGSGFLYLWNEHKDLARFKDQLNVDRKAIYEERLALEKARADLAIQRVEGQLAIEQLQAVRPASAAGVQPETPLRPGLRTAPAASIAAALTASSLAGLAREPPPSNPTVSAAPDRTQVAEATLLRLMSEFSTIGVNLKKAPSCSHYREDAPKHAAARAKYLEIKSVAEAYSLTEKFKTFLTGNAPGTSRILGEHEYTTTCSDTG